MHGHKPVLLDEFLKYASYYDKKKSVKLWDGTLGAAGHLISYLKRNKNVKAYASDCDHESIKKAEENLKKNNLQDRVLIKKANFIENPFENEAPFDIILLDLGISSMHLDEIDRGITFRQNQLLDMRLDTEIGVPVYKWLSHVSFKELRDIIYRYGEERLAAKIAKKIIERREISPVETTKDLKSICEEAYQNIRSKSHSTRNPAVKTFQAFRIFINQEIENLKKAMKILPELLNIEGRLFIISFHSLEDRIVKHEYLSRERIFTDDPLAKSVFIEGNYKIITKKPITAKSEEVEINSRSRSAKMRILERIR
ncbi:MAG: 16S rRNA (cytosine(1402)-N(4))-methyltransferase RsmH [Spirochaetia bacterium]|nr:16S rRNA (cytosine(1402)-N(4))-methyltransferase RsmH [Spirochaetia bacterium]